MEITEKVIDEIVEYINEKVNIPYVPESVESLIIKAVILGLFHVLGKENFKSIVEKQ